MPAVRMGREPEPAYPDGPNPIGWKWLKHVRMPYVDQRAPCGCVASMGRETVGEHCERRSAWWKGGR